MTKNFQRIATWHSKYGNSAPKFSDTIIILKNPKDNWREKEKYCIANKIPYQLRPLVDYKLPENLRPVEIPTSHKLIKQTMTVLPNGVIASCPLEVDDVERKVQRMNSPKIRTPHSFCATVRNFERDFCV